MRFAVLLLTLAWLVPQAGAADDKADKTLDFQEVYDLLKSQLSEFDEAVMEDVAARGLIEKLRPRVQLLEEEADSDSARTPAGGIRTRLFMDAFAYLQLGELTPGVAKDFGAAFSGLAETNRLKGLILDLRFAEGTEYQAATDLADQFFAEAQPLADWGKGMVPSTTKTNAIQLPAAVLVNDQTAGAPELLGAILREHTRALIIGTPSAGEASMYRDFTLATGQRLRVATAPIKLDPDTLLDEQGLQPDILVESDPAHERAWMEDPYHKANAELASAVDGQASNPRRRLNEAELVRMLREGDMPEDVDQIGATTPTAVTGPLIQDPVLARAIDFLKGLSLVRPFRSK